MKKGIKKAIAYLMSAVLTVGLFSFAIPQTAIKVKAEEKAPVKKMQLGANVLMPVIENVQDTYDWGQKDRVTSAPVVYYSNASYKWLVIGNNGTGAVKMSDKVTLFAENILKDNQMYKDINAENANSNANSKANSYANSDIKKVVDAYYGNSSDNYITSIFTKEEREPIVERTLYKNEPNEPAYIDPTSSINYQLSDVVTEETKGYLWLLSTKEADLVGQSYRALGKDSDDNGIYWWLRSPGDYDLSAAGVPYTGRVRYRGYPVDDDFCVRPAFNLNLESILFASAAVGGKSSGDEGVFNTVETFDSADDIEWKLTIKDEARSGFSAERVDYDVITPGGTVEIKYNGAKTGDNEYVSAIITDEANDILYYGKLDKCDTSDNNGKAIEFNIPNDSRLYSSCNLYIFNEQCNGDYLTDYSSDLKDLTKPAAKPTPEMTPKMTLVNENAKRIDYIFGAQESNVFFGTYTQRSDGNGGYNVEPIKWRVLSNSNGQLFMLANQGLDCKRYKESYNEVYISSTWEGSSIRAWLNETSGGFLHDAFVDIERGAIADTLVVNDDNPDYGTKGGNKTTDKIFLLSIAESEDTSFGFTGNDNSTDTRKVISTDYAKHNGASVSSSNGASKWWLRSPGYTDKRAAYVSSNGYVIRDGDFVNDSGFAIRPALNFNLGSLIFTSAAEGGKSSVVLGESEMAPIENFGDGDIVEWKFTLHDTVSEGRDDLKINRIGSGNVANGGTVLFSYEDAVTGENEYLSVILVDENNNLLSYAKVADVSEEALGSAESFVRIPSTLTEGKKYKLRFLSEQCNGDYLTDYASEFAESRDIEFTVGKGTPTLDLLTISIPGLDKETRTIEYSGDRISVIVGVDDQVVGMGEPQVKYYDSEGIELENAPVDAGTYSFKIIIPEDKGYAAAELSSADWKFNIEKRTPTVDDFVVTKPKDTDYDGKGKTTSVDLIDDLSNIGKISVVYFKDGVAIEGEPKDAGEYTFKLNVDDSGKNFNSAENLSKDDWKFTIKKVNPKFTDISVSYPDSLTYDGNGKTVTPGPIEGKTGMGEITVDYYQGSDKLSEPPKKAGEYTFKLNIAGGNNFNGIENLTSDGWKFKIDKATPSTSDFKVDIPSDTTYDGNEKEVTITGLPEGIGEYSVTYYGSDEKPLTGKPKDNGKYKVKISFAEGTNFYGKDDLESDSWNFSIGKATPKASDFDVTVPDQDCTYDGNVKEASVTSLLDGIGTFEVVYYDDKDNKLESAPKEPGTYKVKINVSDGTNYESVVLDNNWTFTIKTTDYKVELDIDGGTVLNNNVESYTYGEGAKLPTADDLKKDGYTFDGWYETKDFSGDKVTVIPDNESGEKKYYAKWIINKYTVKFMNGDEVLESEEYEYGSMPSYDGTPSKDNVDNKTYYFTGWDPAISKVTGDATYTAQFGEDEIIYTITFEANGGSYDVISAITNSQFKLDTIPEPVLEGYKFLGWFSSVDNTKITKDTVFTADTLVYAKWEEITAPEDPGEEEPEETKKIPNYLDELFLKLNIAAELGGKQEVYWNVGDSLPYDVLHFLELHPDITLVFEYTYLDVNYKVTLVGEELLPDPTVPWAGPWYLLGVPKKQKNQ